MMRPPNFCTRTTEGTRSLCMKIATPSARCSPFAAYNLAPLSSVYVPVLVRVSENKTTSQIISCSSCNRSTCRSGEEIRAFFVYILRWRVLAEVLYVGETVGVGGWLDRRSPYSGPFPLALPVPFPGPFPFPFPLLDWSLFLSRPQQVSLTSLSHSSPLTYSAQSSSN